MTRLLTNTAFYNNHREYALGNTRQQRSWANGATACR